MKTYLLFLCLLISSQILNAQWEPCNNGLFGNEIWSFIIDGNNTYVGIDGGIFMTTDNGVYWIARNNGLTLYGLDIQSLAISEKNIFAGTRTGGIFISTDKGENWMKKSNGLPFGINGYDTIYSVNVNTIMISGKNIFAGTNKGIYVSTDYGDNWVPKNDGLLQSDTLKRKVYAFAKSENNLFVGTRYGVFMSTNNGENWFAKNKGIENLTILSLLINGNNIYIGSRYGLFLSTNNGDDWKNIGLKDTAISAMIIEENYIFAASYGVSLSTDYGNSWNSINSGLTYYGSTTLVINRDYIFVGTSSNGIFRAKLSDLGITGVKEQEQTNEIKIFPNPATDEFRLRFHAPFEATVQINIFDLLGNKVLSRTEHAAEGTNEKNINCEKLPAGYYYVKINVNEVVETIPLVIVK